MPVLQNNSVLFQELPTSQLDGSSGGLSSEPQGTSRPNPGTTHGGRQTVLCPPHFENAPSSVVSVIKFPVLAFWPCQCPLLTPQLSYDRLKGYSILDCVVVIDMCEFTPLLKTFTVEQFCTAYIQDEDAIRLSEKILERNRSNGALTVSFVGFSNTDGFNGNLMTFPPDTAPDLPAVKQAIHAEKWIVAQRQVAQVSLGQAAGQMQKNPRVWQAALMKTMKP